MAEIVRLLKVRVPLLLIEDPALFSVIVPALGVNLPVTVKAPVTVAFSVPVLKQLEQLTFRFP